MARYGFDIGGTIDNNPEVAHLARALAREGHKIIIITASDHDKKAIKAKLYALNVVDYYKLVMIKGTTPEDIGQKKGEACNKWKVSLYFDNNADVLEGFALTSKIATCRVMSPDGATVDKPKRAEIDCPCTRGRESAARCFHCTTVLNGSMIREIHTRNHHGIEVPVELTLAEGQERRELEEID